MQQLRWRKAIIISVIFQFFCLGSVGWMAANYFVPPEVEQYLEIELATEVEQEMQVPSVAQQQPNQVSLPTNPFPAPTPTPTPKAAATSPKVVVSDEAMSVVSTDAPAAVAESASTGSSGASANVGSSGGSQGSNVSSGSGNSTAGRKQGGVIKPSILSKVKPIYPQSARSAGIEGTVIVKIQVLTNGRTGNVSVARSSGNRDLDNAAVAAVEQFQFVPAKDRDSGDPIVCYCNLPVKFDLDS